MLAPAAAHRKQWRGRDTPDSLTLYTSVSAGHISVVVAPRASAIQNCAVSEEGAPGEGGSTNTCDGDATPASEGGWGFNFPRPTS